MFAEATKAGLRPFKKKVVSTEKSRIKARLKLCIFRKTRFALMH